MHRQTVRAYTSPGRVTVTGITGKLRHHGPGSWITKKPAESPPRKTFPVQLTSRQGAIPCSMAVFAAAMENLSQNSPRLIRIFPIGEARGNSLQVVRPGVAEANVGTRPADHCSVSGLQWRMTPEKKSRDR